MAKVIEIGVVTESLTKGYDPGSKKLIGTAQVESLLPVERKLWQGSPSARASPILISYDQVLPLLPFQVGACLHCAQRVRARLVCNSALVCLAREHLDLQAYVQGEDTQRLVDIFHREGAKGLATAIESQARSLPSDEIIVFADASKLRLAGNLTAWPAEVPDAPGTYGLVIGLGGGATMRVVASHVMLPGGYHLLMGRESARFESLVERFWWGIAGATGIVLLLGAVIAWLIHRSLLSEVQEISRTASAIVEGDLSRRIVTRGGSDELNTLAQTVNGMPCGIKGATSSTSALRWTLLQSGERRTNSGKAKRSIEISSIFLLMRFTWWTKRAI